MGRRHDAHMARRRMAEIDAAVDEARVVRTTTDGQHVPTIASICANDRPPLWQRLYQWWWGA